MKKSLLLAAVAIGAIFTSCDLNADNKAVANKAALETPKGKYSYAVGMDLGRFVAGNLKQIKYDLDYSLVIQAIKDQLDSTKPALMSDSEFVATVEEFMKEMKSMKAKENIEKQNAFLAKNKAEVGVAATESGLQYIVLAEGAGEAAKDGDTVSVHYTGTLIDGMKFDSSLDRNQPLTFVLGAKQVIPGWEEMLKLMKKGGKAKAWIPSSLGYGDNGNQAIPGGSLLIFEMELLDIKNANP